MPAKITNDLMSEIVSTISSGPNTTQEEVNQKSEEKISKQVESVKQDDTANLTESQIEEGASTTREDAGTISEGREETRTEESATKEEKEEGSDESAEEKVDLDEFEQIKKEALEETPKEEPKKEEPKKEEVKEEESSQRDYSGYTSEEIKILKQMSKHAFEYVVPRLKENAAAKEEIKQLKEQVETLEKSKQEIESSSLPESYLDHEKAFVLDPKYEQQVSRINYAKELIEYFRAQRKKIKQGESWDDLRYDSDGKIVKVKMEPSEEADEDLAERIQENNVGIQQASQELSRFVEDFQQKAKVRAQKIKESEDMFFPQFATESSIKENPHIQKMSRVLAERKLQMVPASTFSKLYAVAMQYKESGEKFKSDAEKAKILAEQVKQAGPSSSDLSGATKKLDPLDTPIDFSEFDAIKQT